MNLNDAADLARTFEAAIQHRTGGEAIKIACEYIMDTQAELARLSGLTANTITALKKGQRRPTKAQRSALAWAVFKRWS